jgi:hypothetical protein
MSMSNRVRAALLCLCVACGDSESAPTLTTSVTAGTSLPAQTTAPSNAGGAAAAPSAGDNAASAAALQLPPLEVGYQRLMAPGVEVPPGTDGDWMQWVGGPTDQDYDLSEMRGAQSKIGHHAILYTTSLPNAVGTTRPWTEVDQLTTQTLGGVGAEGAIPVPAGVVMRVKKGSYLVFDVHYLNASDRTQVGETYMDIKLGPANPNSMLASRIANSTVQIALPPHQEVSIDLNCQVTHDLKLVRFTNHMHEHGTSTFTEYIDPSGVAHMIKSDPTWSPDWSLAPNYTYLPVEQPLVVPAGSVLHTRCAWNNNSDQMVSFPSEMCAFSGLVLGSVDTTCLDGQPLGANGPTAAENPGTMPGAAAAGAAPPP